jgi:ureidoacrylate peracid hydrolase
VVGDVTRPDQPVFDQPALDPARFDPTRFDPAVTALLLVDLQNSFCHPDGTRSRLVGPDRAAAACDLPRRVRPLIELCRRAGTSLWWTRMEDTPQVRPHVVDTGVERIGGRIGTCAPGSWDVGIVDALESYVGADDEVVVKHRASAFFGTDLDERLAAAGVTTLVVAGTTTSYCVESTIRDAYARDFGVVVVAEATADTDDGAQAASLAAIDRFHGWVTDLAGLAVRLG